MKTKIQTRKADERGRVSLGPTLANRNFVVDRKRGAIVLTLIPERETWLYQNEEALSLVREGLQQAKRREFANVPRPRNLTRREYK